MCQYIEASILLQLYFTFTQFFVQAAHFIDIMKILICKMSSLLTQKELPCDLFLRTAPNQCVIPDPIASRIYADTHNTYYQTTYIRYSAISRNFRCHCHHHHSIVFDRIGLMDKKTTLAMVTTILHAAYESVRLVILEMKVKYNIEQ